MHKTKRTTLLLGIVVCLAIVFAPLVIPANIATEILIFGMLAMSANLLLGTCGLYSFGQAAFFGVGGYVAGYLFAKTGMPLLPGLLMAMLGSGVVAALVGAMSIRRSGVYFMMLTFAFNQMIYYLAYSWTSVTGGEDGLGSIHRPSTVVPWLKGIDLALPLHFYGFVAILFLATWIFLVRLTNSPLGLVLLAAKQNSRRTSSLGYSVYRAQWIAFSVAGALGGLAGACFALLYRIMPIDAISWTNSGTVVFMVVIGGMQSILGPVMGAAIFIWLQGFFSLFWARWPLLFGVFIILVTLFLRGGLVELIARVRARVNRPAPSDASEEKTL